MNSSTRKLTLFLAIVGVIAALGYGLVPEPKEVDLATIEEGDIRVTVDQDGKTRIRERYIVSAPLAGRLLRIDLDPGDAVDAGKTLLATIEPRDPELLDARTIAQSEARVNAAEAALAKMVPTLEEAEAAQEYAENEWERVRDAHSRSPLSVSESEVESKQLEFRVRNAVLRSARHNEEIARFELEQAKAALIRSRPQERAMPSPGGGWNFMIRSPIDGRVLRVFQESSAVVIGGTSLLEVGDPRDLEVEIDVLSRDAVRIPAGARVMLEHWGGERILEGRVRLVEPSAFTKISTLGVEEQRVNVIVDLLDPPQDRPCLGDGFRVEARIVVEEAENVLKVPTSALFRIEDEWAVFVAENSTAKLRKVKLGLQNGLAAEVVEGLSQGDSVVVHPGDNVTEGTSIRKRD